MVHSAQQMEQFMGNTISNNIKEFITAVMRHPCNVGVEGGEPGAQGFRPAFIIGKAEALRSRHTPTGSAVPFHG
ncbi:MAG: hypothetical protein FWG50_11200 [Kiritimatiellaeota bacterium]|nr:hypothetical protein [Kiritimatiellota bacterium]